MSRRPKTTILCAALAAVSMPSWAAAEPRATVERDAPALVLIETDPATFALRGYAAHVRVAHPRLRGVVIGAGLYGMALPSLMTEMHPDNRDEGWRSEIDAGYGVFADYHVRGVPEGAFVGVQLALQRWRIERSGHAEQKEYATAMAMARAGYLWRPFAGAFYVLPWVGVGADAKAFGDAPRIGDDEYTISPVIGFATVHLGWRL